MRRAIIALFLLIFTISTVCAAAEDFLLGVEPEPSEITPSYRSEEEEVEVHEACFWCTPMSLEDEEAVWAMLTSPITVVQAKDKEKALDDQMRQTVLYAEPDEKSEKIGTRVFQAGT